MTDRRRRRWEFGQFMVLLVLEKRNREREKMRALKLKEVLLFLLHAPQRSGD